MRFATLWAPLLPCALALNLISAPAATADPQIILHAIPHPDFVHCFVPQEMGYENPVTQTVTSVPADAIVDVFVYFRGYEQVLAVGLKLVWPADWQYRGWGGDCLPPYQITITNPGPGFLDVATAFNERTGGDMLPIGFVSFRTGSAGEVRVEGDSRHCIADGAAACYVSFGDELPIPVGQTGRVAIGGPGYNPAGPLPVADATWGAIKAAFRN